MISHFQIYNFLFEPELYINQDFVAKLLAVENVWKSWPSENKNKFRTEFLAEKLSTISDELPLIKTYRDSFRLRLNRLKSREKGLYAHFGETKTVDDAIRLIQRHYRAIWAGAIPHLRLINKHYTLKFLLNGSKEVWGGLAIQTYSPMAIRADLAVVSIVDRFEIYAEFIRANYENASDIAYDNLEALVQSIAPILEKNGFENTKNYWNVIGNMATQKIYEQRDIILAPLEKKIKQKEATDTYVESQVEAYLDAVNEIFAQIAEPFYAILLLLAYPKRDLIKSSRANEMIAIAEAFNSRVKSDNDQFTLFKEPQIIKWTEATERISMHPASNCYLVFDGAVLCSKELRSLSTASAGVPNEAVSLLQQINSVALPLDQTKTNDIEWKPKIVPNFHESRPLPHLSIHPEHLVHATPISLGDLMYYKLPKLGCKHISNAKLDAGDAISKLPIKFALLVDGRVENNDKESVLAKLWEHLYTFQRKRVMDHMTRVLAEFSLNNSLIAALTSRFAAFEVHAHNYFKPMDDFTFETVQAYIDYVVLIFNYKLKWDLAITEFLQEVRNVSKSDCVI